MKNLGAPCHTTFQDSSGRIRADVQLPEHVNKEYGGGFVGLLRPDLYSRMLDAIPSGIIEFNRQVTAIEDCGDHVSITFDDGKQATAGILIGADGIDSMVRKHLWGDSQKRNHDLHVIGGFTFEHPSGAVPNECVIMHDRYVQGTYSSILSNRSKGFLLD